MFYLCSNIGDAVRRPVSRVLSRDGRNRSGDGHSSGTFVTKRLARPTRAAMRRPIRHRGKSRNIRRSYLVLLPVGFALPPPLPAARCALTAPFHPCRPHPEGQNGLGGVFLWHFPWGRPRRALPGTAPPWSPDFPPSAFAKGGHPTVWLGRFGMARHACQIGPGKYSQNPAPVGTACESSCCAR